MAGPNPQHPNTAAGRLRGTNRMYYLNPRMPVGIIQHLYFGIKNIWHIHYLILGGMFEGGIVYNAPRPAFPCPPPSPQKGVSLAFPVRYRGFGGPALPALHLLSALFAPCLTVVYLHLPSLPACHAAPDTIRLMIGAGPACACISPAPALPCCYRQSIYQVKSIFLMNL